VSVRSKPLDILLNLQELDLVIETCKLRELEIPKQKKKIELQKKRLATEITEREETAKSLQLEQGSIESEISQKQAQVDKYEQQTYAIKKNEELRALLHEIDALKKQILSHEERIITLMLELDDVNARLEEDGKRVAEEIKALDQQSAEIDAELEEAVKDRQVREQERLPLLEQADPELLARYQRIRRSKKTGAAIVPLRGDVCGGCHVTALAQTINEVLAGTVHPCLSCGRLLYDPSALERAEIGAD
jgi:predicted  nucleic acid-binding Zn-ribbon protein